jgi:D-sedoheptulose 7-phosphate isomerase
MRQIDYPMINMNNCLSVCLERYPSLVICENDIRCACDLITNSFRNGSKLLICGNGGSASDSGHIAGELLKNFCTKRKVDEAIRRTVGNDIADNLQGALPAISLPDMVAINSAYANDCNPQYCFAQLTYGLGKSKDTLLCISTSGDAKNVVLAAIVAKSKNMNVIGLTGATGGMLAQHCDVCIKAPESETFKVQELHLPIYHTLCLMLEQNFFG